MRLSRGHSTRLVSLPPTNSLASPKTIRLVIGTDRTRMTNLPVETSCPGFAYSRRWVACSVVLEKVGEKWGERSDACARRSGIANNRHGRAGRRLAPARRSSLHAGRHKVAVHLCDELDADLLRTGRLALAVVRAVAEPLGVHCRDHRPHALGPFGLALR